MLRRNVLKGLAAAPFVRLAAQSGLATAAVADKDTLIVAAPTTPPGLDWEIYSGHEVYDHIFNLNDGLMRWKKVPAPGEEGGYTIGWGAEDWRDAVVPRMAESWEVSEDGKIYKFNLRKGWISHYGNEFNAADVKWWVDRSFGLKAIGKFFLDVGEIKSPDSLEIVDDYTVRFHIEKPTRLFPLTLSTFWRQIPDAVEMQKHVTDSDPWATQWLKVNAGGFGPYKLERLEPGSGVTWVAHERHPFPPKIKRVLFREVPESSARASLLARGEVDVAQFLTPREYQSLKGGANTRIWNFDGYTITQSPLNPAFPPLDNRLVRQALSYAVPYDDIVKGVYLGYARPAFGPVSSAAAGGGYPGKFPYKHDPEKARKLLAEAGLSNGFATWYGYSTADPLGELVGVQLKSAFAEVGVKLELRAMPPAIYTETVFGGKAPLVYFNLGADSPDPNYALRVFYQTDSTNNWGGYRDTSGKFDACVTKGADITNFQERVAFHSDCNEILVDDAAWLWIAQPGFQVATKASVTGVNWYSGEAVDWSVVDLVK
jgi:peptide/nickel transport system substrate-binding protein